MAQWAKRDYTKAEIDRAGALLVPWWTRTGSVPREEIGRAYMVIDNWRASHAYPLNAFQMTLRQRARRVDPKMIVAQRLKRFLSVMNKLSREPTMKLSQMQDLGGCRAIVTDVAGLDRLLASYSDANGLDLFGTPGRFKSNDYIRSPKTDGYRGVHVVGRYMARKHSREDWNGHRIEVQLRTRLQHAFATTVETVSTFTRQPLKSGGGPDDWKRFFSLMGSALAMREGTQLVPDTPTSGELLVRELRDHARALRVKQRLRGWSKALTILPKRHTTDYAWLLLTLDVEKNTISVEGFTDGTRAGVALGDIEHRVALSDHLDAVLVNVSRVRDLRKAYPNYYADTGEFISALDLALK